MKLLLLIILLLAGAAGAAGQDTVVVSRPTLSVFTVEAGYASVHDSYLTPITYDGAAIALAYQATRAARFSPHRWQWQLNAAVDYNRVENQAGNNDMHKLMVDLSWGMSKRWRGVLSPRLELCAGPMTGLRAGAVYDAANSNNTVTARAHWHVGLNAAAAWRTHLRHTPLTLRWQVQLPVAGVFFAPQYDESYYEIYLGNHKHLAHLGWWGNRLDVNSLLGADLHLGSTIVRIGYRARLERWTVSHITVHDVSHSLVIGIGANLAALKPKPY